MRRKIPYPLFDDDGNGSGQTAEEPILGKIRRTEDGRLYVQEKGHTRNLTPEEFEEYARQNTWGRKLFDLS